MNSALMCTDLKCPVQEDVPGICITVGRTVDLTNVTLQKCTVEAFCATGNALLVHLGFISYCIEDIHTHAVLIKWSMAGP